MCNSHAATTQILSRCALRVASSTDGRTTRGARDKSINDLTRAGVDPTMATCCTLAAVAVGETIGAAAAVAHVVLQAAS